MKGEIVMNITNLVSKLHTDYNNQPLHINPTIEYDFVYHHSRTRIIYTQKDSNVNALRLITTTKEKQIGTTLRFNQVNNEYYLDSWLPSKFFQELKNNHIFTNEHDVAAFLEMFSNAILNCSPKKSLLSHGADKPSINHCKKKKTNTKNKKRKSKKDLKHFETFVCSSMSPDMAKKIYDTFSRETATQIIIYCGSTMTLRFTDDINKSKDIRLYLYN